jgi:hypothetical protein
MVVDATARDREGRPTMADTDVDAWEERLIEHMRANGGKVTDGPLAGHPLIVMTSHGAKSGKPRRAILTISRDGSDYLVAGTAGGARRHRPGSPTSRPTRTSASKRTTRRSPRRRG